jgi:Restriction endonuclease
LARRPLARAVQHAEHRRARPDRRVPRDARFGQGRALMHGKTTIERGNTFRDLVASMLEAAGFVAETETREQFKKVDVRWRREDIDGLQKYLVEAKDHAGTLSKDECGTFVTEYGGLIDSGDADRAWLVSKGQLSADGRALVDNKRGCKAMTFAEFQRRLLGLDSYLHDLIVAYDNERIAEWYIPLHDDDEKDLEKTVRAWIEQDDALPLAIVAAYGKGKSTSRVILRRH